MNDASTNVPNETTEVKLPPKFGDLTGKTFARLTVMVFSRIENHVSLWLCKCCCGNAKVVRRVHLITGHTQSCGCLQKEKAAAFLSSKERRAVFNYDRHKKRWSQEYASWGCMKHRCLNPNSKIFKHYGGRGIAVCARWLNSFENFLADMGAKPSPRHSIERINNNGNYEPGNCKWATKLEQMNNTRANRMLTINGRTQTMSQWAREAGVNYGTLHWRIGSGLSPEDAVFRPISKKSTKV